VLKRFVLPKANRSNSRPRWGQIVWGMVRATHIRPRWGQDTPLRRRYQHRCVPESRIRQVYGSLTQLFGQKSSGPSTYFNQSPSRVQSPLNFEEPPCGKDRKGGEVRAGATKEARKRQRTPAWPARPPNPLGTNIRIRFTERSLWTSSFTETLGFIWAHRVPKSPFPPGRAAAVPRPTEPGWSSQKGRHT
jgi:hypothetical protein